MPRSDRLIRRRFCCHVSQRPVILLMRSYQRATRENSPDSKARNRCSGDGSRCVQTCRTAAQCISWTLGSGQMPCSGEAMRRTDMPRSLLAQRTADSECSRNAVPKHGTTEHHKIRSECRSPHAGHQCRENSRGCIRSENFSERIQFCVSLSSTTVPGVCRREDRES
jgi:hypothetical protein